MFQALRSDHFLDALEEPGASGLGIAGSLLNFKPLVVDDIKTRDIGLVEGFEIQDLDA